MATYTGTADINGDFNIAFSTSYTGGQKVTVTAEKDLAQKTIEIYAPSEVTGGGVIQFTGSLENFPQNIGGIVLSSELNGSIGAYAFQAQATDYNLFRQATSLYIPDTVTGLGGYCFHNWTKATSLRLSSSITDISSFCFQGWIAATSLTLPASIVYARSNCFQGWVNAISVNLNNGLQTIETNAFGNWSKCAALVIPNTVQSLGNYAFQAWSAATALTISNNALLQTIPDYCFTGWSKLSNLTIPDNIKTVNQFAFSGATSLTNVVLSSGLISIGAQAFANWTACTEIICRSTTPPTLAANAFSNLNSTCVIKVPSASLSAYQAATNWSAHASKMVGV